VAAGIALGVLAAPLKLLAAILFVIGSSLLLVWLVFLLRSFVPEEV
jgi:hypothetical protein